MINCFLFSHSTKPKRQTIPSWCRAGAAHVFSHWLQPRVHLKLPLCNSSWVFPSTCPSRNPIHFAAGGSCGELPCWSAREISDAEQMWQKCLGSIMWARHCERFSSASWRNIHPLWAMYFSETLNVRWPHAERKRQACRWTVSLRCCGVARRGQ